MFTDDGRQTDGRRVPVYTISSPMSLRLRLAKKEYLYHAYLIKLVLKVLMNKIPSLLFGDSSCKSIMTVCGCLINKEIQFLRIVVTQIFKWLLILSMEKKL